MPSLVLCLNGLQTMRGRGLRQQSFWWTDRQQPRQLRPWTSTGVPLHAPRPPLQHLESSITHFGIRASDSSLNCVHHCMRHARVDPYTKMYGLPCLHVGCERLRCATEFMILCTTTRCKELVPTPVHKISTCFTWKGLGREPLMCPENPDLVPPRALCIRWDIVF